MSGLSDIGLLTVVSRHGIDGLSSISERAGTQSGPLLSKRADGAGQGEGVNVYGIDTVRRPRSILAGHLTGFIRGSTPSISALATVRAGVLHSAA